MCERERKNLIVEITVSGVIKQDITKDCRSTGGSKEKNLYCKICKKNNHAEKDCYFRDRETKHQKNNTEKVSFLTQTSHTVKWVVDSGTISHMVNRKEYLNNTSRINSSIGVAKTDETMIAKKIGSMSFDECSLKEVRIRFQC